MIDADKSLNDYFKKHIKNMRTNFFQKPFQIFNGIDINELIVKMNKQNKYINMSATRLSNCAITEAVLS